VNFDSQYMSNGRLRQFGQDYEAGFNAGQLGRAYEPGYNRTRQQKEHYRKGFDDAREGKGIPR
jgi:hypothetical protein